MNESDCAVSAKAVEALLSPILPLLYKLDERSEHQGRQLEAQGRQLESLSAKLAEIDPEKLRQTSREVHNLEQRVAKNEQELRYFKRIAALVASGIAFVVTYAPNFFGWILKFIEK